MTTRPEDLRAVVPHQSQRVAPVEHVPWQATYALALLHIVRPLPAAGAHTLSVMLPTIACELDKGEHREPARLWIREAGEGGE